MIDVADTLARNQERLDRLLKSPGVVKARARRLERRGRSIGRRLWRMAMGVLAVIVAALAIGTFVMPLGFAGLMLTIFSAILVMLFLARYPKSRDPTLEALPQTELKAIPAHVEDWLDSQRRLLPAPAAREVDRIMVQLDQLSPELAKLNPQSQLADDARRLIGDHLPRLVKTYAEVPASHRSGAEATAQLRDGLKVVGDEISRLGDNIARQSLNQLEVEGRFLETRYKGDREA